MDGNRTRATQPAALDVGGSAEDTSLEGMLPVTLYLLCFLEADFSVSKTKIISSTVPLYEMISSYFLI